jgi:16S rRNA (guanine527-N7)-methyltransferase
LGIDADVLNRRVEDLGPLHASVISARALAPLRILLSWAEKHLAPTGICLFPKGETVHKEIEAARREWTFKCITHPSQTSPTSAILEIGAIERD